jgi:hypothetical protein
MPMEDNNYKTALKLLLQAIRDGKKNHELHLTLGATPPALLRLGVPALSLTISAKAIDKCHFDHGVTEGTLARLYDLVANPTTVFKSDSPHLVGKGVDALVVVTVEDKAGNPLLVALHMNVLVGRAHVNQIKSVYDKPVEMLAKWRDKGLVLWDRPEAPAEKATVTPIKAPAALAAPVVMVKRNRLTKN